MAIQYSVVFAYVVGIIVLFLVGRLFLVPIKYILKLIYNALIGGVVLLIINSIGGLFGFSIAFNVITALVVGTLGIPGVALLVVLKFLF